MVIGEWARPGTANGPKHDSKTTHTIWATKEDGLHQVGCIYSAQGFEFDYCGVIFGNDLVWDETSSTWQGIKSNNKDRVVKRADDFTRLVLHTYRVLLSRGMKGTYVYFLDDATRRHFEEALTQ